MLKKNEIRITHINVCVWLFVKVCKDAAKKVPRKLEMEKIYIKLNGCKKETKNGTVVEGMNNSCVIKERRENQAVYMECKC